MENIGCLKHINLYDKKPIIISKKNEEGYIYYIEEKDEIITSIDPYYEIEKLKGYILVQCPLCIKENVHSNIKDCYSCFKDSNDKIKKATEGIIDCEISGLYSNTTLKLFFQFLIEEGKVDISDIQKTTDFEYEFLVNSMIGPIRYSDIGYIGVGHKYDINSFYPSIMKDYKFEIPIKEGINKRMTTEDFEKMENIPYGIYRGVLFDKYPKYFKININGYYTHFDLKVLKEYGSTITFDNNAYIGQSNCILYPKETRVRADYLFKKYIEFLYKYKKQEDTKIISKLLLNTLWGVLTKTKKNKYKCRIGDTIEIKNDTTILDIEVNDEEVVYTLSKKTDIHYGFIPRLKPFLLSQGRARIGKIVRMIDDIVYIHTDGFITKTKNIKLKLSDKIGELKYEGIVECDIKNLNIYKMV